MNIVCLCSYYFSSSKNGFFTAISKFAACLGAGTFAWLATSLVVVPSILFMRSKLKTRMLGDSRPTPGEFAVLGEDEQSVEGGMINGKTSIDRKSHSVYYHLLDQSELQSVPFSRRTSVN